MLSILNKKIELLANIAIVLVGCALVSVLIKNHLLPNQGKPAVHQRDRNETLNVRRLTSLNVDWKQNPQTIVLAISTTCHFCTESAPFYRRVAKSKGTTRLVAVLPQSVIEGQQYLAKLGVVVDDVRQAPLGSMGLSGTPTIMLVDTSGFVVNSWVGLLPYAQENDVLNLLRSRTQVGDIDQVYIAKGGS